nr:site-specific integrase [Actinomycetota bacterium]
SRTFHGDRAGAEARLDELVADVRAGRHGDAEITLGALLEVWLDAVHDDLSPTTYNEYARLSRNLLAPSPLGRSPVRKVTSADLIAFYRAMKRSGRAVNTIRNVHAVLRGALDYAVLAEWIDDNPAARARRPRGERRAIKPPTPDQVVALVTAAAAVNAELAAFLRLAVATGARRGELCGLRRSDVDLEARTLHIQRAIVHDGDRLVVKDTKTHADRLRKIGPNAAIALRDHLEAMDKRAADVGVRISKHAYVFSGRADCATPMKPDTITTYFVTLRNSVGLKTVRLHDLRHFRVTQELDAGIPMPTVSEGAGHANSATTAGIYAHGTEPSSELAADVADDLFG